MTPEEEGTFHQTLLGHFAKEDSTAYDGHLASGVPVYYVDDDYDIPGHVVKGYPSGRKELVTLDELGEEKLIMVIRE